MTSSAPLWQVLLIRLGLGVLLRWTHPQRKESEAERTARLRREWVEMIERFEGDE